MLLVQEQYSLLELFTCEVVLEHWSLLLGQLAQFLEEGNKDSFAGIDVTGSLEFFFVQFMAQGLQRSKGAIVYGVVLAFVSVQKTEVELGSADGVNVLLRFEILYFLIAPCY